MTPSENCPDSTSPALSREAAGDAPSASDFVQLFLADQRRIHCYIIALIASHQDSEDLLQETAAILWRRFGEFQPGSNFFAWACATARLNVLAYRRRQGRDVTVLDDSVFEKVAQDAVEEGGLVAARTSALEVCLDKLLASDRQLLQRCYAPGVKATQVAAELGRPKASLSKSLGRIRRSLAECIRRSLAAADREGAVS